MTNYWGWLFLLFIPVLVFSATPESSLRFRLFRLLFAIALGYGALNMMIQMDYIWGWREYEQCQSQFPDGSLQQHPECGTPPNGGLSHVMYFLFGWIPAAAYTGFWEMWWRRKHRYIIAAMKDYRGKKLSTALIVCSVPVWLYFLLSAGTVLYMLTVCPANVASSKCWFPD